VLNPQNEAGRLTLYGRFGYDKIADRLPRLMKATKADGRKVVWAIDPMHGNTLTAAQRLQDPAVRPHPVRGEVLRGDLQGRRRAPRRRAPGDDRPERHRVPGRRPRRVRKPTSPTATTPTATRA
jgi:hypothetical protein